MIRVLLVEDDPVIRDTTCYFLKSQQNFEVVCAETGGDALSHAREKFDVILMDILLPDTNGVDLCQRLRSWHHCPIIFTSCLDDTDTIVRALEMGGDDFLAKPYNNKILLARIMANIRRVQQRIDDLKNRGEFGGWTFPGGEAKINESENRLQLFFEEKPTEDQRRELKSNGFKWAPSQGAWQRQLTKNAIYAAGRMEFLRPEDGQSPYQLQPFARKTEKDMTR